MEKLSLSDALHEATLSVKNRDFVAQPDNRGADFSQSFTPDEKTIRMYRSRDPRDWAAFQLSGSAFVRRQLDFPFNDN